MRSSVVRRLTAAALAAVLVPLAAATSPGGPAVAAGSGDSAKIFDAFAKLKSYKLTVLGSVRSSGVWVAPNRYEVTTDLGGQVDKTVIVGKNYWIQNGKGWDRSTLNGNNLAIDAANLLTKAKSDHTTLTILPTVKYGGATQGTFSVPASGGSTERCNYDLTTYHVTRCKAEDVTILYSGWNDPGNKVDKVS